MSLTQKYCFAILFITGFVSMGHAFAEADFTQTLPEAIGETANNSALLKSAFSTEEAGHFQAKASSAALLPNLSLQGNYFYQANVPTLNLGPIGAESFGTHSNYSAGPVLSYNLFDGGHDRSSSNSADLLAQSREQNRKSQSAQLELSTRQTYFRVQYSLRQLELTVDSLKLSLAQSKDIEVRFQAGASSRLDEVQAKRDVISYQLKFRQAQADLSASFRDLLALEGNTKTLDTSRPISESLIGKLPEGTESPTLQIHLDTLEATLANLKGKIPVFSGESHPEARALQTEAQSTKLLADSETGNLYPKIVLQAKAMYEYPNIVIPESIWQETFGASLVFPLFEGNASHNRANQYLREAAAMNFEREQKLENLSRDELKAKDAWSNLEAQRTISNNNVALAQEVERLTYQSYRAGKSRYLDVEDANVKLLEAQVSSAQIDSEILNELAILNYLSAK